MEVIYSLIPGMIILGLIFVGVLIWAVKGGQYEDMDGDGQRILMDDDSDLYNRSVDSRKQQDKRNWPDADE